MIEQTKEKPIKGLKIKYDGVTFENIIYFSISTWNGKENVSFTNKKDNNTTVSVNCEFSDIEIIKE